MTDVEGISARLARVLATEPGVRLALLFGSYARRTATEHSDVDIAVDASNTDALALSAKLASELGLEVDVLSLERPTIPLLEELIRDGVVVYERVPGTEAAWRAKTLAQLETDRPWYHRMRDAWIRRVAERGLRDGQ